MPALAGQVDLLRKTAQSHAVRTSWASHRSAGCALQGSCSSGPTCAKLISMVTALKMQSTFATEV